MKFGFIIDQRKCIGCHACTTACKAEHQVPVGVNRTWVKQVEKGEFPNTRRLFSVMRCNHCTDAPCVDICPTQALFVRDDGIVDFNNDRCIGCKSCMQACPYDALYIDPESNTAAKCNYCAHRVDVGLEPACVNVCPEHAIISGDMDNPDTEISQLLSRQQVKVRKPEKGTSPNVYYIDADDLTLVPEATEKSDAYYWNSQSLGVGHFAKEAEKMANANLDLVSEVMKLENPNPPKSSAPVKSVEVLMNKGKRTYDSPDKGILWGWEVSAYVWTKAISAGAFILPFIMWVTGIAEFDSPFVWIGMAISTAFLGITGLLLIKDLDRPDRFLYVLLRPQWSSWLVRGGYAISVFGALVAAIGLSSFFKLSFEWLMWPACIFSVIVATYTAFLFAQAKGRDFWQSPTLAIHMLVHSIMAGAAVFVTLTLFIESSTEVLQLLKSVILGTIAINLITISSELMTTHPTNDSKNTVSLILKGRYKNLFWLGMIMLGNALPFLLVLISGSSLILTSIASLFILIGLYITEHIWVEAPQRISLS
ncbi:MAG: polysulfide reductase NrfD [Chitinophagales bacterium]|nr:polysulfide reductase NrfD [Chitinophagales bacterium]